jgi:hypothetical protein
VAEETRVAVVGSHETQEHAQRRGFARAVGSKEPADVARAQREGHTVDGEDVTEALYELARLEEFFVRRYQ